jgi:ubiquinone/menaquinone biosynthesis C-methylase UbiE
MRVLEIGPGEKPVDPSWDTMDMIQRPGLNHTIHDVRNLPLPVPDESYGLVYMSHILEHIPWTQTVDALREIRRILIPGGSVEIWVPDLAKLVDAYIKGNTGGCNWRKFNKEDDPVTWFNGRVFTYGPGEENWHRALFDAQYLKRQLRRAGFVGAINRLRKPRGYDHGWINLGMVAYK